MLLYSISVSSLFFGIIVSSMFSVSPQRIRDKMYEPIEGASACFRRLNGTHQFGCSSHRSGNVGILQLVEDDTDLAWLVEKATVSPYMAVLHPHMFTKDVLWKLKTSGKVNGVVLINNSSDERPVHFSHEDKCPNRYSGLSLVHEQTCNSSDPWNRYGTGISMIDWGFPIFHVGDDDNISKLRQCYSTHNAHDRDAQIERSLCALEMNSFMLAAVDSKTCIRRSSAATLLNRVRYCDPLGDRNIWSTLYPRYKSEEKNNTVIVVAARLDGTSMFDSLVPGAVSPVSGIVTLLMTARILARIASNIDIQHDDNVMFVLLNGESYDYIGSSRLVWDMMNGVFPMKHDPQIKIQPPPFNLHNIKLFVELEQISLLGSNDSSNEIDFYVHEYEPVSNNINVQNVISSFVTYLNDSSENTGLKFKVVKKKNSLPPSSLQSVLARSDTAGVIVADHESQYLNTYYHSIMDDSNNLKYTYQNKSTPSEDSIQSVVAKLSRSLALTLHRLISESNVTDVPALEPELVDELFHCYLDTMDCPIFQSLPYKQKLENKPASLYVGVNGWLNPITTLTAQALALLVNQTAAKTEETCNSDPSDRVVSYIWMHNVIDDTNSTGACIKTTMNFSSAVSPAFFEVSDYDWSSGKYSTWTESIWREFSVRMFLKPSRFHENLTFALGVVVLALSFLIVYFANSQSHVLFGNTFVLSGC